MTPQTDGPVLPETVKVVDSHTGGEPTRVVTSGGPDLGSGSLAERRDLFRNHHDHFRTAIINEPRGSDILVGALLCEPVDPTSAAGVIFFDHGAVLGMCGHGSIGVAVTLAHLGRITPGTHRLETPVGNIAFDYHGNGAVTIENVPSYRHLSNVEVDVEGHGPLTGDIAWGGNWFFITNRPAEELVPENIPELKRLSTAVLNALQSANITGADGAPVSHVELSAPSPNPETDARNFVLCPSLAFDRSPCGTGTSAKVACLMADGKLAEGQTWRQESIIGSIFEATGRPDGNGAIIPRIRGEAFVTAESTLHFNPADPFREGTPL